MKPMTKKQMDLILSMEDYGCQPFDKWMEEHPNLKHECSYTAHLYIEDNMDYYREQKKFLR